MDRRPFPRRGSLSEVELVQNPALGALLLWTVASKHEEEGAVGPRLDLCFLVLPLLFHTQTQEAIKSTQPASGLSKFVLKMRDETDLLLAIHQRALEQRELSLASLAAGITARMLVIDTTRGQVLAVKTETKPPVPERLRPMVQSAERLGAWFARLPPGQVMSMLRVHS
jgi:hypothetical protein